jgi:hypothetical protein
MATARTITTGALTLIGVYAQGETPSAADAQDALRRLNLMVSSWRTQFGTVVAVERDVFTLTANQQTYTIGLGGAFNVQRPMTINGAGLLLNGLDAAQAVTSITRSAYTATVTQTSHGFSVGDEVLIAGANELDYNGLQTVTSVPTSNTYTFTVQGTPVTPATGTITAAGLSDQPVEIPRTVITDDGYQAIQIKTLTNAQFTNVYYNPTFPLGTVFLWPCPNTAENQLVLYLQNAFSGFANLTTNYEYPDLPGYAEALEYNLAVRLAAPYGRSIAELPDVVDFARTSLGLIKRANTRLVDLPTDASLLAWNRRGGYNINTGTGGY